MTIRAITAADADTAGEWWQVRGEGDFFRAALPPLGCVAEDDHGPAGMVWAACWCNVGIAQLEFLIMRPGLSVAEAIATGRSLMAGVESALKAVGYSHIMAYALPACARFLLRDGWEQMDSRAKTHLLKVIS